MWVYDCETLALPAVNQAAIRQYGFTREELLRMTLRELRDPRDPRNLEWQTSATRAGPLAGVFVRHRRKDGTLVEAETTSDEIVFNGRPARLVVAKDLTTQRRTKAERARLAHAIGQERAMHASILAGISDALLVVGADSTVWYANARLGDLLAIADVDAIIGQPLQQLLDSQRLGAPADADAWDTLERALAERSLEGFDLHFQGPPRRDLRCHPFIIPEMSIPDLSAPDSSAGEAGSAGSGTGLLLHDVTTLREVSRLKDEIIGIVSHELRAPLASVLGFAELLLKRDPPPEQRRQYLTVMLEEGERLSSLISDFLDLEHLRHGLHGVTLVPIDPRDLLIGAVTAADSDPDHPIILDVPMSLPPVLADADRMRQVLWNLLSNARKYSPDPGEIRVAARRVDDQLAITVTDHGVGIPRAVLPQLFDRFFRVDERDGVNVPGAGLGLSIVKQLVEAHGGSVWAQSEGVHQGACFGFSLRFAEVPPGAASTA